MLIRPAQTADFGAMDAVISAAFAASAMGDQGEAGLVRRLHTGGDALVSLVAEEQGHIIGHVMFSRMTVEADGQSLRAAGLAPVAVLPDRWGKGVGAALIAAGIAAMAEMNIQISFVLGHPHYYPRFGYSAAAALPFASPYAGPHFMALWLDKGIKTPESGRADYAAAFSG